MDASPSSAPFSIVAPQDLLIPVVVASPHSGTMYPDRFLRLSRLDLATLRRSEDAHVDVIVADVPTLGAPLLRAHFPRVYCDVNRAAWELDPGMFRESLPSFALTATDKIRSGLGMIPRVAASGRGIYREQLPLAEAHIRIAQCWQPYHTALDTLLERARARFGFAILLDIHSMPHQPHRDTADIVLGDARGQSASPALMALLENEFRMRGYSVARNTPYAGGYATRHHGRPDEQRHAIQIEMRRALYMDETTLEPHKGIERLRNDMRVVLARLASVLPSLRDEMGLQELDSSSYRHLSGHSRPGLSGERQVMSTSPKEKAAELAAAHGAEAATIARRHYETALEEQEIGQQGYWLDVIEHLKGLA